MYNTKLDYYNYANNNYNQPLYTEDNNPKQLYDPYQSFIRGNSFPHLYNGYKVNPIDLKPMNEQAKMLTTLDSLCFALTDLNLYLDIYPNDRDMIGLFNQYREETLKYQSEYDRKYGSLLLSGNLDQMPWEWLTGPWPWERM